MRKIKLYIYISFVYLVLSCQSECFDFEQVSDSIIELSDGRLRVPILLDISEREVIETKMTDMERSIKTVDVCVFDVGGNVLEKVNGKIDPTNPLRVFAKVLPRKEACKIQVYVNIPAECRVDFGAAETLEAVQVLTMSSAIFSGQSITDNGLPMISELKEYTALNSTTLADKIAKLKFAYARIDVTNLATGFTLSSCQGLNFRQNSYLTERTPLVSPEGLFSTIATDQLSGIYLFESPRSTPTDLLIKGTKTGFGEGYYKIRIAYGDDKKTYEIRRGVRYAVNLTNVKGPGYASAEEAIANEPANIEYDVAVDDGSSKDVVISNGSYYLGVSNSEYIIYADEAIGVIPVTITHNAPSTVSNTKITLTGAGMSFYPSQPGLTINGNEATISERDGSIKIIPLRIDFAANNLTEGAITIRIGDLVKTINVIRKDLIAETAQKEINLSDLGLNDCLVVESQSERIVVNSNTAFTVKPVSGPSKRVFSIVNVFTSNRGNIRIAVKRDVQNVVYYEKYSDNSLGLYLDKSIEPTIKSDSIIEAGYAIVNAKQVQQALSVRIGSRTAVSYSGVYREDVFDDCIGSIYFMNQNDLTAFAEGSNAELVTIGSTQTKSYIYPNFAKGVYQGPGGTIATVNITDGSAEASPFAIRTPKQFRNINAMAANSYLKFFKQERDLNFADENIGGLSSFNLAIVSNAFSGEYNGSGKRLENLTLYNSSKSMALFDSNWGVIKDVRMHNINVTGGSNSACLVGINRGNINTILIDGLRIYAYGQFVGGITGHNSTNGYVNNCMVMALGDEGGSGKNTIYSTSSEAYIGGIAGCNHRDSRGIENVCVLDLQRSPQRCFVHSSNSSNTTSGIVGYNEQTLENAIHLAMPPYGKVGSLLFNSQFPICRYDRTIPLRPRTTNTYYLQIFTYDLLGERTGIGRYTNNNYSSGGFNYLSFANATIDFLNLDPTYWEKVSGYPYPKLKSFPKPETWPVKN